MPEGTRSEISATSGAIIAFRPTIARQYHTVSSTGLVVVPVRNSVTPPSTAPNTIHGVRRPKRERERSENAPKTRFATSEAMAVAIFTMPSSASGAIPSIDL